MSKKYELTSDFNVIFGIEGHRRIMSEEQVIDLASDYQANVLIPEEEADDEPESADTIKYMQEDLDFLQNENNALSKRLALANVILDSVSVNVREIA